MTNKKEKKHIIVSFETMNEFNKFKSDLSYKLKQKITSDRLVNILINSYKFDKKVN